MAIQDFEDWSTRVYWDYYFTILQDTPVSYDGAAKKSVIVNDTETGLNYSNADVDDHSARHEEGGVDEVTGITGKLNDHSARHEDGGADPINNLGGNVSFPDRSYWNVYMSGGQNISADSEEKLLLDSVKVDNRNEFDAVNNKVIIENSGFYLLFVNICFRIDSDQDRINVRIKKNGTDLILKVLGGASGATYQSCNGSIGVYLTKDDELTVVVENLDSADLITHGVWETCFSGCLIA